MIGINEVATKACKKHKVNPGSARLLNNSFAQTTLLQLLPAKHPKCHAVVVANAALMWDGQQPDVQTVEAALLMRELQVEALLARGLNHRGCYLLVSGAPRGCASALMLRWCGDGVWRVV